MNTMENSTYKKKKFKIRVCGKITAQLPSTVDGAEELNNQRYSIYSFISESMGELENMVVDEVKEVGKQGKNRHLLLHNLLGLWLRS